tara:strand:- start:2003 stop:2833 length:831 start_codon:yes stop_codon:yes gene_type:complete
MSFGSNFPDGDWKAAALQAVPVLLSTAQAVSSQIQYNKLKKDIDNYQRQGIINPYANASNPYRNLGVATKAAEMKMEQADIALANTLDTLRSTGAAAGGATALAQAALQSKQGVTASIEQQELQNQRLVAKGEQMLQQQEARGKAFQFRAQEAREMQELNRLQAQADQARAQRVAATEAGVTAFTKGLDTLAGGYTPTPDLSDSVQSDIAKSAQSNLTSQEKQKMINDIVLETPVVEEDQQIIEDVTFKNLGGVGYTSPSAQIQSGPISFGTQVNI